MAPQRHSEEWPNVARIVHLQGGIQAINEPDKRVVLEPSSEKGCAAFNLQSYRSLYAVLERHFSLGVIGCEFIERPEQVRGWVPPEWRPFRTDVGWLTTDVAQTWSEISHSAFRINKIVVAQQARHIAAQLRICSFRLRDLSRSYNNHLRVLVDSGKFQETRGYVGNFSEDMFNSVHALLFELCTLRDFITSFVGQALFGRANLGW